MQRFLRCQSGAAAAEYAMILAAVTALLALGAYVLTAAIGESISGSADTVARSRIADNSEASQSAARAPDLPEPGTAAAAAQSKSPPKGPGNNNGMGAGSDKTPSGKGPNK